MSASQNALLFPQPFTEKHRPRTIAEFVGLERPKAIAQKLVENPFQSAWLFLGQSGVGKTTLALAIADAIPAELHHIPATECTVEEVQRVRRICQFVPRMGTRAHLVLIDEVDSASDQAQKCLLSKLDSTDFPPDTIFILTANGTERLEQRFLSRLRRVDFETPHPSEIGGLLRRIADVEAPIADRKLDEIAWNCRRNVRDALMQLEVEAMCPTPDKPEREEATQLLQQASAAPAIEVQAVDPLIQKTRERMARSYSGRQQ